MTTTNTMVAKIAAVVAGFGLVLTGFAPMAGAQTTNAELEAQIAALMAQIAALQAQTGGSASASMMFSRDLTIGSTGADVTALQNWLIKAGYAIPAGATGYFGAQTQAALAKYQAANMISPAAGYFGPITRAKVNASAGGSTGGNDGDDDDDNDDLSGGEASLEDLNARDGEDDDVEEADTAMIAEFEFDVEDGDIEIQRLDLTFEAAAGNDEDEPWETFDTITLYDEDGNELASEDVSDEDDWLDEDEPYVFRFTGLDYVVREGDMGTIMVEVEAQNGIDGIDDDETWTMYIDTDGLRGTDGEGIEQYLGDEDESVTFDVVEEGHNDDLSVRRSGDDPDSATLQVEDDGRSDWYTIFAFELDSDEDSGEIEINEIPVVIDTNSTTTANVINDLVLMVDGEEFDDFDVTATTSDTATYTFDIDGDLVIDGGDVVTVEVMAEFKAQTASSYPAGQEVFASVDGAGIDAEGADDVTVDGSATGDTHTLVTMGIDTDVVDTSAVSPSVDGSDNDVATFEVEVEIMAFEQDVYISATSSAFTYQIEDDAGDVVSTSTATSSTVSSSADTESNGGSSWYVIDEGSTETFTFRVTYNPLTTDESQSYRMQLLTIRFGDEIGDASQTYTAAPATDFETDFTFIND